MRVVGSLVLGIIVSMVVGCRSDSADAATPKGAAVSKRKADNDSVTERSRKVQRASRGTTVRGVRGTYSGEPRGADGRIDIDRLAEELESVGANTYNFLIKVGEHDWEDVQRFLPLAREREINVWVTVTCPSKKSRMSQPFGHDYVRWAQEIASLSVREPNLVAWGMDDFSYNNEFFTRRKLKDVLETARAINPHLAFVPTVYYKHAVREGYAEQYKGLFDAVLFPYRAESSGRGNLADARRADKEIGEFRAMFGKRVPIILDVYASRHSQMGDTTPEYVERVMQVGREHADGVMVFRHQTPGTPKWEIVSTSFHE
jgi:hypothetical protein